MSNLSDLLPAGASAKQLTFTDSGSGISSKAPVVLNSDGTVSGVSLGSPSLGALSANFSGSGMAYYCVLTYDTTQDRVVAWWANMSSGDYPTATVGSISGGTITWGTPVVVLSAAMSDYQAATYDSNLDKHLIIFTSSSQGKALMGTVTAATNTISFGATETFSSSNVSNFDCMYDPSTTKSLIVWRDSGSSPASRAVVATPASDSSISFGSVLDWTYSSYVAYDICCAYDTNQNKVVVGAWEIPSPNYQIANYVATISGTSVTFGARQQAYTTTNHHGYYNNTAMDYDKSANAIVNFWRESGAGYCIAGTISGASISYGSATAIGSDTEMQHAIYSDQSSSIALSYFASTKTYLQFFSTSGTTITVDSQIEVYSTAWQYNANVYDPDTLSIIVAGNNGAGDNYGYAKVYEQSPSNLTAQAFVGVADSAISASAAGSIIVQGGTVTGVASGSGLSAGSLVAFETSGSPSAMSGVAFDANAGKMVIAYSYGLNGYAIVGTVSGTSASYGTAAIFQAASPGAVYSVNAAYDANAQKVVIIYTDGSNSNYPTAIVGTVSGTSISFGTKIAFLSSSAAGDPMSIAYDANAQKVVIGFRDTSNSNYGTGIVGTVSGTSISFGTKTAWNSSEVAGDITAVYDSNAQKVAIAYRDAGNSSYGTAVVGTVSGTSISFGSAQVFLSAQMDNLGGCFDSTNNKVVFCYRDTNNSNYGTAIVGTISGTSISFGSSGVYNAGGTSYNNASYDAGAGKVIISYAQGNAATIAGTVSGTSISFDTAVVLDAGGGMGEVGQAYDSTNAKTLIAFQSAGNSYHGYSATATYGDLPLTVGTKYYVTTSGGFSSSAGDPSVNAGLAISTTSLLLNGDS